ncbi:MAG: hypothetical protein P8H21_03590 [Woeseiaceae bacterium]|nr:hypothetical protein [Woeseiaceae bacterium]
MVGGSSPPGPTTPSPVLLPILDVNTRTAEHCGNMAGYWVIDWWRDRLRVDKLMNMAKISKGDIVSPIYCLSSLVI